MNYKDFSSPLVDEVWTVDPVNPNFTRNDFGTLNSVLTVD